MLSRRSPSDGGEGHPLPQRYMEQAMDERWATSLAELEQEEVKNVCREVMA